jgi:hypothetical protein
MYFFRKVKVNGKIIEVQGDHKMPFVIAPWKTTSKNGLVLPPLTFGFFVFPDTRAKACLPR